MATASTSWDMSGIGQMARAMLGQQQSYTQQGYGYGCSYPYTTTTTGNYPYPSANYEAYSRLRTEETPLTPEDVPKEKPIDPFVQLSNHKFHELLDKFAEMI